MPKLWNATIATHRQAVRDAVVSATLRLVEDRGLLAVTMSDVAAAAGIARATLYKYFPDVESILSAWHQAMIGSHLDALERLARTDEDSGERLEAVLTTYAQTIWRSRKHADLDLAAVLHAEKQVVAAQHRLHGLLRDCIAHAVADGHVRADVDAGELASWAISSVSAATSARTEVTVERVVRLTMDGLSRRPAPPSARHRTDAHPEQSPAP